MNISGRERKYLLYVPESYQANNPTPLVISIHGFADWPARQQKMSGWSHLADEHDFIVVYPSGTGFPLRWVTGHGNSRGLTPEDEVEFIAHLIDHLAGKYHIDHSRVYVNGFSNGGGMAFLLACKLPDRIAAVGIVSGAFTKLMENCDMIRQVPLIIFHGTADPVVPYHGRSSAFFHRELPDIPTWVQRLAERYHCSKVPVLLLENGEVSAVQFASSDLNVELVFYTIHNGGHSWPGGKPLPGAIVGHTTQDINATREMWKFFKTYRLSPGEAKVICGTNHQKQLQSHL